MFTNRQMRRFTNRQMQPQPRHIWLTRRRSMKRDLSLVALALSWLAGLAAPTALVAQDNTVDMEEIVIEGSAANAQRINNLLRIADRAILDYVDRSTRSIQQGHRHGFSDFRNWYRAREARQAEEQATNDMIRSLIGTALGGGLNVIFPGSGTFVKNLRKYSQQAYDQAAQRLGRVPAGDINRFLDQHENALEAVITEMLDVPETFRHDHPDVLQAAKWEFVFERLDAGEADSTSTELGPRTRRMLLNAGVPAPGSATAEQFRVRILARQLQGIFMSSEAHRTFHTHGEIVILSRSSALKHIHPNDPNRYCPEETRLSYFWQSETCRRWRRRR